jgi:acyl-CoA thioester hydrolase
MESTRPLEIEMMLPVRTYDIDFAGVVNNIVYVRWLEDLRLEMLARYFPLNEALAQGIAPMLVQTTVNYKQSIRLSDQPIGKMWAKSMESVRWTVTAEIWVADRVAVLGEQVGVFIDVQSQRPIRIPADLKQKYQDWSIGV